MHFCVKFRSLDGPNNNSLLHYTLCYLVGQVLKYDAVKNPGENPAFICNNIKYSLLKLKAG